MLGDKTAVRTYAGAYTELVDWLSAELPKANVALQCLCSMFMHNIAASFHLCLSSILILHFQAGFPFMGSDQSCQLLMFSLHFALTRHTLTPHKRKPAHTSDDYNAENKPFCRLAPDSTSFRQHVLVTLVGTCCHPSSLSSSCASCQCKVLLTDDQETDKEDDPCQESFFSNPRQAAPKWFHLSAASNHFQSADSLSTAGTPSCSTTSGIILALCHVHAACVVGKAGLYI